MPTKAYKRTISKRAADRLLERYCLAEGAKQAAAQAQAIATALEQRFRDDLDTLSEAPEGADIFVDYRNCQIVVTPKGAAPATGDRKTGTRAVRTGNEGADTGADADADAADAAAGD